MPSALIKLLCPYLKNLIWFTSEIRFSSISFQVFVDLTISLILFNTTPTPSWSLRLIFIQEFCTSISLVYLKVYIYIPQGIYNGEYTSRLADVFISYVLSQLLGVFSCSIQTAGTRYYIYDAIRIM